MYVTLAPAFGRDYKTAKDVKAAWDSNTDFIIQCVVHPSNGRYINKSDTAGSKDKFSIRYCRLALQVSV